MPDAIASIMPSLGAVGGAAGGSGGGWLSSILPYIMAGSAGAGTVGNILGNNARNNVLSSEMSQMNALNKLTPAQITAGITSLEQPLSGNLINSVTNATQGKLAERGLSQAPGIFSSELAQGLAPYQLQEQQMAQNAFFQKLGLPISARPSPFGPFPQSTNTNQIWQMLMSRFMNPSGSFGPASATGGGAPYGPSWLPESGGPLPTSGFDINSLINLSPGLAGTADTGGGVTE